MLSHFDKLNTSLKSVHQYPTLGSQQKRFRERGWEDVAIWDLWEAWNSDAFLASSERLALDDIEPFDEWEEFILFARHYFVLHAQASPSSKEPHDMELSQFSPGQTIPLEIVRHDAQGTPKRRYGASMLVQNPEGQSYAVHALGMGTNGRLASCDVYAVHASSRPLSMPPVGPPARVCHSLTDLGIHGVLLAGGRTSPTKVSSDCWIYKKDTNSWQKSFDLPSPLFRHCAVRLPGSSLALVLGGKSGHSLVSPDYFVFHPGRGWLKCLVSGRAPDPVFGAVTFTSNRPEAQNGLFSGVISGGMLQDGTICNKIYQWELNVTGPQVRG